jgi:hypothetical protein
MLDQAFALVFMVNVINMNVTAPYVVEVFNDKKSCDETNDGLLATKLITQKGQCIPMADLAGLPVLGSVTYREVAPTVAPDQTEQKKKERDI